MTNADKHSEMSLEQREKQLKILKERFEKHPERHAGLEWTPIQQKLEARPDKLRSLIEMEATGGEPDVAHYDTNADLFTFFDFSPETPLGRRNLCYDRAALEKRKVAKPRSSALDMAEEMGIEILTEEQYRYLQTLGAFDLKTSSWIQTPGKIRKLGGALFCDRRYDTVFTYHNGADSYYAARGFRGELKV